MKLIPLDAVLAIIDSFFDKHSSKHDIDEAGVVLLQLRENVESLKVTEVDLEKEDVNSILERIDNEIDRLLFNNGREIDYEDVIKMIRCEIRTIRNEIKAQKGE